MSRPREIFTGRHGTPLDVRAETADQLAARLGGADCPAPAPRPLSEIERDFLKKYQADNLAAASAREIEAEVVSIGAEWILLDLSGVEARMPAPEMIGRALQPGDMIKVAAIDGGGLTVSARLADGRASFGRLKSSAKADLWVDAAYASEETAPSGASYGVADVSGYWGLISDARASGLVPGSEPAQFRIEHFDADRGLLVLSRLKHLQARRAERARACRTGLKPGDVCQARFERTERGDGLFSVVGVPAVMPAQDAAHAWPHGFFRSLSPGSGVRVMVLKNDLDGELIIGRRQLIPDPWLLSKKILQAGSRLSGTVVEVAAAQLWVEIQPELAGEVPWREAGWGLTRPDELALRFRAGDRVDAVVLQCASDPYRLTLSIRQAKPNPALEWQSHFEPDSPVTVRAMAVHDAGVDVVTPEGQWGFVRAEDLSWDGPSSPRAWPREGQSLETVFLGVEAATKRLLFGRKQLTPDLFAACASGLAEGQVVNGRVVKKIEAGILVEISRGVVGLVHKSEIPPGGLAEPGDSLDVQILEVHLGARRISLSWSRVIEERERQTTAQILQNARGGAQARTVRMENLVNSDVFQKFMQKAPPASACKPAAADKPAETPSASAPSGSAPPQAPAHSASNKGRTVKMDQLIDSDLLKKFMPRDEGK